MYCCARAEVWTSPEPEATPTYSVGDARVDRQEVLLHVAGVRERVGGPGEAEDARGVGGVEDGVVEAQTALRSDLRGHVGVARGREGARRGEAPGCRLRRDRRHVG